MRANILATEAFTYTAEVRPIAAQAGAYSFSVSSKWAGAKDPNAQQVAVQMTLDAAGLRALRDLIDAALALEEERKQDAQSRESKEWGDAMAQQFVASINAMAMRNDSPKPEK